MKAKAVNLANCRKEAGVRLELSDHLQKDFRLFMNVAYDLHKDLKGSIKFDEEDTELFMDVQIEKDGVWKRIKPDQAKELSKRRRRGGPEQLDTQELRSLVGSDAEDKE